MKLPKRKIEEIPTIAPIGVNQEIQRYIEDITLEEFINFVDQPRSTPLPSAKIVYITPEIAEWAIMNRRHNMNASLKESNITRYGRDMIAGEWSATVSPIQFGNNGILLNGHNRFATAIKHNVVVPMTIEVNVNPANFKLHDIGQTKKNHTIHGLESAWQLGPVNELILVGPNGTTMQRDRAYHENWLSSQAYADFRDIVFPFKAKAHPITSKPMAKAAMLFCVDTGLCQKKYAKDVYSYLYAKRFQNGDGNSIPVCDVFNSRNDIIPTMLNTFGNVNRSDLFMNRMIFLFTEKNRNRQKWISSSIDDEATIQGNKTKFKDWAAEVLSGKRPAKEKELVAA